MITALHLGYSTPCPNCKMPEHVPSGLGIYEHHHPSMSASPLPWRVRDQVHELHPEEQAPANSIIALSSFASCIPWWISFPGGR